MSTETLTSVETFETPDRDEVATQLADAISSGATVTVTRHDGKTGTGTLVVHGTDPDYVKVVTGKRGRPLVIHRDDVDEISFE